MTKTILGAAAGFLWGSISIFLLYSANPNPLDIHWSTWSIFLLLMEGGGSFATVGAVFGAVSALAKSSLDHRVACRSKPSLIRAVGGAVTGFLCGSLSFLLIWSTNPDETRVSWRWSLMVIIVFLSGGPAAGVGAILSVTSAVKRAGTAAALGFSFGCISYLLLWRIEPLGDWGWVLIMIYVSGGPFAVVGAVMGTTSAVAGVHTATTMKRLVIVAATGFLCGNFLNVLQWWIDRPFSPDSILPEVFLAGGPFAALGAVLGAVPAIQNAISHQGIGASVEEGVVREN